MRGILAGALLAAFASDAGAEPCPGDRGASLAVEAGVAYVTLDDGVTRAIELPSGRARQVTAAAAPPVERSQKVTVGGRTFVARGDCRESELRVEGEAERARTAGLIVAVAAAGSTVVALRHDGVLLIVPPRGQPRPRVARWRQR